ncbi:hypothetical protein PTSG_09635 [Salpingoeca rosetta]|uniref:Glycosyltransferase 2-like domain-containing protein n=1 Tax=Salpingoeca rosetta (strain ATCC 50818 / BSB-021) TaxID=946362 RepID=F2ULJ8_SALR5|nr:uncharacterized protein PTSG_09635 [Salpingoeca rosetta]EGD77997.1 hypothetical protein PTSG_09635 [Salpingoeca rosetta]|eukprot:XP_004990059.1 hypothetical protein PTSG_09635 [Salpingoeca rosetta]
MARISSRIRVLLVVLAFSAGWVSRALFDTWPTTPRHGHSNRHHAARKQPAARSLSRGEQPNWLDWASYLTGTTDVDTASSNNYNTYNDHGQGSPVARSIISAVTGTGIQPRSEQEQYALQAAAHSQAGVNAAAYWRQLQEQHHLRPLIPPLPAQEFATQALRRHGREPGPVRVCLVTSAMGGPTPSGGVGTAFHALAMHLAEATSPSGEYLFAVSVVYAAHPWYGRGKEQEWVEHFAQHRIRFLPLTTSVRKFYGPSLVVRSYKVMELLRERESEFDVVTFHDHMGIGYFTTMLKRQGLAFQRLFLFGQGHGTIRWADHLNYRPPKDHNTLAYYHMEQKAMEWADARVYPSRYYLDWAQGPHSNFNFSHGYSFVVQNLLYPLPHDEQAVTVRHPRHFVFFGRLEVRKGLLVFLDALAHTTPQEVGHVSFLGPSVTINDKKSVQVIEERMAAIEWPTQHYTVRANLNSEEALKYIEDNNAVAVIPTLGDNSPYVVIELVAREIPLITTTAGGGAELLMVTPDTAPYIVEPNDAKGLAGAMQHAVKHGISNYRTAVPFSTTRSTYLSLVQAFAALRHTSAHASGISDQADPDDDAHHVQGEAENGNGDGDDDTWAGFARRDGPPKVLLGITSHDRPGDLERAVQSLINQEYASDSMTVMIVDDASTHPDMNATLDRIRAKLDDSGISHRIVTNMQHRFVAQTRNDIIAHGAITGKDFVCFLDDDDEAEPTMVQVYMKAALRTNADLVTDISDNFDTDEDGNTVFSHRSLSLGDGLSHNLLINNFGKANFCVRPGKAMSIGGHYDTMPYADSPYVDWSFLTRASLSGLRIELVPLPLYRYTKHSKGSIWYTRTGRVDQYNGHYKIIQDALAYVPPKMADLFMYCRYKLGQPYVPADGAL